jgi:hypothetical protein
MKIFGREPAAIVGLIEAALVLSLSFGLFNLTQDTIGIIMAVVSAAFGVYLAYVTNETLLGAVVGLTKAVIALGAVYGLALTTEQTGAAIAFITLVMSFWQRTQVTPMDHPSFQTIAPDDTGVTTAYPR